MTVMRSRGDTTILECGIVYPLRNLSDSPQSRVLLFTTSQRLAVLTPNAPGEQRPILDDAEEAKKSLRGGLSTPLGS
jgi:hypothetical protein